jgi:HK97 family phage major capsid protein
LAPALRSEASLLKLVPLTPLSTSYFKQPYTGASSISSATGWSEVAEGSTANDADEHFGLVEFALKKHQRKVSLTDELMEDYGPQLQAYVERAVGTGFIAYTNQKIVSSSGTGASFEGLLSSTGTAEVDRDTALTIVLEDVLAMYARMPQEWRIDPACTWIANPDVLPKLQTLVIQGSTGGVVPAYLPPNGVSGRPYDTLLGTRIVFVETEATIGTRGDLLLCLMSDYMAASRTASYVSKIDLSVLFLSDKQQLKFTWRAGGKLGLQAPIARLNSSANTFSTCIVLGTHTS